MELTSANLIEIIVGLFILWVGIYLTSKNPFSLASWTLLGFLGGFAITLFTEPILRHTGSWQEYYYWQKMTDWPLFLSPVMAFHTILLTTKRKSRVTIFFLIFGYLGGIVLTVLDIRGGIILHETVLRFQDFRRFDGFEAGILLIPFVVFITAYLLGTTYLLLKEAKKNFFKFFIPALGGLVLVATGVMAIISYYTVISLADVFFGVGSALSMLLIIYSIMRYHLFNPTERIIFDRTFLYKTMAICLVLTAYWVAYILSGARLDFHLFVFIILSLPLVLFSHSFYEWLSTFVNDFIYNASSGLSVVNDEEVSQALKDYCHPDKLENSSLLRLKLIAQKIRHDLAKTEVEAIKQTIKDSIEHFRPEADTHRRIKQNMKYHLLKMIAYDQAEEGQILWELGFDEYPVAIMSRETRERKPLFKTESPSDYYYTSRNAYLALKKEAIHDVTWRISYLEKLNNR